MQCYIALGLIMLVSASIFAYKLKKLYDLNKMRAASKTWPSVEAVVRHKKYLGGSRGSYFTRLRYTYLVQNIEYDHELNLEWGSEQSAQENLDAIGSTIPVAYNPLYPQQNYLGFEHMSRSDWAIMANAVIFGTIALAIFLLTIYWSVKFGW